MFHPRRNPFIFLAAAGAILLLDSSPCFAKETLSKKNIQISHTIVAREHWNNTGIHVEGGGRYHVRIASVQEPIVDGEGKQQVVLHGLEGWDSPLLWPFCLFKRRPLERYFALIGTVDQKHPRRLREYDGKQPMGTTYVAPASGTLWCYFNDWNNRYDNNHGKLKIAVWLVER